MVPPTEPLIEHSDAACVSHPRPLVENHHAGGIIVTHARNSAPVHEPSDADDDFEMDDSEVDDSEMNDSGMDDSEEHYRYTLKSYIIDSWLPAFKIGPQVMQNFVWPHYQELEVAPGTRKLRTISRILPCRIHAAQCFCEFLICFFLGCVAGFCDIPDLLADFGLLEDMQLDETLYPGDLTLPSVDFEGYDEKELKMCIQDVSSVADITNLLTRFVLRTIANCLHILHDVQERDDAETVRELLQFRRSCTMCPVKDDIFDVVFLVCIFLESWFALITLYSPVPIPTARA
jgi:hypothetical protein